MYACIPSDTATRPMKQIAEVLIWPVFTLLKACAINKEKITFLIYYGVQQGCPTSNQLGAVCPMSHASRGCTSGDHGPLSPYTA